MTAQHERTEHRQGAPRLRVISGMGDRATSPMTYLDRVGYEITRETVDGIPVHVHHVPDVFSNNSPESVATRDKIAWAERYLQENPHIKPPSVSETEAGGKILNVGNNRAASMLYDESPTLHEWRRTHVPTAFALVPLQHPDMGKLPNGIPIDDVAKKFFEHGLDATAIRARARVMERICTDQIEGAGSNAISWVALGSGAADPNFAAIAHLKEQLGVDVSFHAVDMDPEVLAYTEVIAGMHGINSDNIKLQTHLSNLVPSLIRSNDLIEQLGGDDKATADIVDLMGVFEYFKDNTAKRLLAQAYRLVKPGGTMVIGNMLSTRPELEFNQRGVGWGGITPRSVGEVDNLIRSAGIEATYHRASDGVYLVAEIHKPHDVV